MKHTFSICAYKDSPYIEDCIVSLENQAIKSNIIMCTSTPSSYLSKLAERHGIRLYVREGKSSLFDDWNFAAEKAVSETNAELVTIAHQDDIYERNYTRALAKAVRIYPDMSLFCTRYRTIDKDGKLIQGRAEHVKRVLRTLLRMRRLADKRIIKRSALILGNGICCPSCTYNIKLTGLPVFKNKEHFVIDWETLLRLADEPGRFVCVERELMDYRIHDGAETKKNIDNHNREHEEYAVFKGIWPAPVAWLIMRFYRLSYSAYGSKDSKADAQAL